MAREPAPSISQRVELAQRQPELLAQRMLEHERVLRRAGRAELAQGQPEHERVLRRAERVELAQR